jgi:hypothetical protein
MQGHAVERAMARGEYLGAAIGLPAEGIPGCRRAVVP